MVTNKICYARIRTYDCSSCGMWIDRDLNASINILNWEPWARGG
ncbi:MULTISPECIES: zinc ribbon domain-containing protein [unclassified Microcoleus]